MIQQGIEEKPVSAIAEAASRAGSMADNTIMSRGIAYAVFSKFISEFHCIRSEKCRKGELSVWWQFWPQRK